MATATLTPVDSNSAGKLFSNGYRIRVADGFLNASTDIYPYTPVAQSVEAVPDGALFGVVRGGSMIVTAAPGSGGGIAVSLWSFDGSAFARLVESQALTGFSLADGAAGNISVVLCDGKTVLAVPVAHPASYMSNRHRWVMAVVDWSEVAGYAVNFFPDVIPHIDGNADTLVHSVDLKAVNAHVAVVAQYGQAYEYVSGETVGIKSWGAWFDPATGAFSGEVTYDLPVSLGEVAGSEEALTYAVPCWDYANNSAPADINTVFVSVFPAPLEKKYLLPGIAAGNLISTFASGANVWGGAWAYGNARLLVERLATSNDEDGIVAWYQPSDLSLLLTNPTLGEGGPVDTSPNTLSIAAPFRVSADVELGSTNLLSVRAAAVFVRVPNMLTAREAVRVGSRAMMGAVNRLDITPVAIVNGQGAASLLTGGMLSTRSACVATRGSIALVSTNTLSARGKIPSTRSASRIFSGNSLSVVGLITTGAQARLAGANLLSVSGAVRVRSRSTLLSMLRVSGYFMGPQAAVARHTLGATSFALVNGVLLVSTPNGLHALDGSDDNGTKVRSSIRTRSADFESPGMKGLDMVFAAATSRGKLNATITADGEVSYTYASGEVGVHHSAARRIVPGRGARGRWWQIELINADGEYPFTLHALEVVARVSNTRRSR